MTRRRAPAAEMNLRQARFVAAYLADPAANGTRAAIAAGYAGRHAASRAYELLRTPAVRAAIDTARAEIVQRGKFDAEEAMRRLDAAAQFARETENATALARVIELQLRLHGMLIDKAQIQVERVDIGSTMLEARKRAFPPVAEYQDITDA